MLFFSFHSSSFHIYHPFSSSSPPYSHLFLSILSILGGCIRAWRPLGEFGGVAPTVSCYLCNQQQPQQHGVSAVSSPKSCEWCYTARSAARATHHSHSKQRGWWEGGEDVSKCVLLDTLNSYITFSIMDINASLSKKVFILIVKTV